MRKDMKNAGQGHKSDQAGQEHNIEVKVTNFRGCRSAKFVMPGNGIALIGGRNAAGKSSIAQAVAAGLTGNPIPVRDVAKAAAGQLVRSGSASGSVWVATDKITTADAVGGSTEIAWPQAKVTTTGAPAWASDYAAGLSCVLKLDSKKRAAVLSEYLGAEPNREDYDRALKPLGLPTDLLNQLWHVIQQSGWDGAHSNCKEKGAKLKGQWEQITGDRYGSKKAENWLPQGWEPHLDGESEESLQEYVNDARQVLEAAIAAEAVDDSKRADLEEKANKIIGIKEELSSAADMEAEAQARAQKARERYNKMSDPTQRSQMVCPECGTDLRLKGGTLERAEALSADEVDRVHREWVDAREELEDLDCKVSAMIDARKIIESELEDAVKASSVLEELNRKAGTVNAPANDIETARKQVRAEEIRLRAWQQKTQADNRHLNISLNAQLVSALAPDGIRQQKLSETLGGANMELKKLSSTSGFGTVQIENDLTASLNGTPYGLLSKSERWRARVVIQLWMASVDGSDAAVIDGADVLADRALRNGLIKMLQTTGIPSLVTMALPEADAPRFGLPDLDTAGAGRSYWIENGELMPRSEAVSS